MKPTKMRNRLIYNASHVVQSSQLGSTLSDDLRKRYGKRSVRVTKGDHVSIQRGEYKGVDGKVNTVLPDKRYVAIEGIKKEKTKGDKFDVHIHTSNLMVTSLNTDDKWRMKVLHRGQDKTGEDTAPKSDNAADVPAEVAKPEEVVAKPEEVVAKPEEVVAKPEEVVAKPEEVVAKPEEVVAKPEEVVAKPEEVVAKPEEVVAKPEEVVAKPEEVVAKPEEVVAKPEEVVAKPEEAITAPPPPAKPKKVTKPEEAVTVPPPAKAAKPKAAKPKAAKPEEAVTAPPAEESGKDAEAPKEKEDVKE